MRWLARIRFALAAAFLVQLPAEVEQPLLSVGPVGVTNLELTAYLFLATWVAGMLTGQRPVPRIPLAAVGLLAVVFVAAIVATFAAADTGTSMKVLLRLSAALLIGFALASELVSTPRRDILAGVAVGTAVATAVLGILEYLTAWDLLGGFLGLFRDAPVSVGGFVVRATGTLLHPNLAAWYWGLAGVAVGAFAVASPRRWAPFAGLLTVPLFAAAVLALSRGALVGIGAAGLAAIAILARRGIALPRAATILLPLAVVAIAAVAVSPAARARLISESDQEWYRFSVSAPAEADLVKRVTGIEVTVTNESPVTWRATGFGSVAVAYHIRDQDGDYIVYDGGSVSLPHELAPGASVRVVVPVAAPRLQAPATIEWDLVQGDETWFSTRLPQEVPITGASVDYGTAGPGSPAADPDAPTPEEQDLYASRGLTRGALWDIALGMLVGRPLTGIGLDNYRLTYGSWAGLSVWDQDFNATNVYLELLVGIGIAAVLLFVVAGIALVRLFRRALRPGVTVNVVALLTLVSFAAHGVFDSFITFSTAMYLVLAAVALGLWESHEAELA